MLIRSVLKRVLTVCNKKGDSEIKKRKGNNMGSSNCQIVKAGIEYAAHCHGNEHHARELNSPPIMIVKQSQRKRKIVQELDTSTTVGGI